MLLVSMAVNFILLKIRLDLDVKMDYLLSSLEEKLNRLVIPMFSFNPS